MNIILYFQPTTKHSDTLKLMGVKQLAQKLGWRIQIVEAVPTRHGIRELIDFWHPLGAIVECDGWSSPLDPTTFSDLPTVFLDPPSDIKPDCELHVSQDSSATGREAAKELLILGRTNFAYVPFHRATQWSDDRAQGFIQALAINGFGCSVFRISNQKRDLQNFRKRLRDFLLELPKPASLFAANDEIAEAVLAVAAVAGLRVPEDLAVLGVDNFEPICESTSPTLSSIEPDFLRCGELAALLLHARIRCGKDFNGERTRIFSPARIVRRASTRIVSSAHNQEVVEALELIRREACLGLTAARVLTLFDCSAPLAYARFQKATGHTILEEIHAVQLERCKTLLADPGQQLKAISDFCGFTNPNSLRKFFLRETGMTMTAWRQRQMAKEKDSSSKRS